MSKIKTNKSITKRFKITKNKKLVRRAKNQNHFNARATGNMTRKKHSLKNVHDSDKKQLLSQVNN